VFSERSLGIPVVMSQKTSCDRDVMVSEISSRGLNMGFNKPNIIASRNTDVHLNRMNQNISDI